MKQKHFINSHKGVTFLAVLLMMTWFNQWQNPTAWLYLALHGTYGWLWVLKGQLFPDKQWEPGCSIWYGLYIWAGLSLYWVTPYIITSTNYHAPAWLMGLSTSMYVLGVFLHFTADMQKFMGLRNKPGELITDGLMSKTRNINYFGELLIYLGFSMLAMHWFPILVIVLFLLVIWMPNMRKKDRSLSRYPGFAEYKKRTKLFIPFLY
jgi:steroid 5-alpha reductase family enzyme